MYQVQNGKPNLIYSNSLAIQDLGINFKAVKTTSQHHSRKSMNQPHQALLEYSEKAAHLTILNLITNAFHADSAENNSDRIGYQPLVLLSTEKCNDHLTITLRDNGNGIPPEVFDKIFQPFFTAKPTGRETELGLSVRYDLIKIYGGEIKMNSQINKGTVFTIFLPING